MNNIIITSIYEQTLMNNISILQHMINNYDKHNCLYKYGYITYKYHKYLLFLLFH